MRSFRSSILVASAVLLAACGSAGADREQESADAATAEPSASVAVVADADRVGIVVSTSILGDVVASIAGGDADVEVLMGPGVDPHGYQPSAAQARSLREADLVIVNGLQLEEALVDTLEAATQDGVRVLELAPELDPLPFEEAGDHDEHGDEDDHGGLDPHVWFDPERMALGAEVIAASIAEVDGTLEDDEWEARGLAYADELLALDDELEAMLIDVPEDRRKLVTNHDAFGYLAAAYDLEVVGTVIPGSSTQVDTSAADFRDLVAIIRDAGITTIFAETSTSDRLAEALGAEVGSDVSIVKLFSGALGEPGSGADTYQGLMRTNVSLIANALG